MESPTSTSTTHDHHDHHDPPTSPPLHRASQTFTNLTSSALNYFTEPISYTFSGISRRISNDDAPTPLARALSANYNGSMTTAGRRAWKLYSNSDRMAHHYPIRVGSFEFVSHILPAYSTSLSGVRQVKGNLVHWK